MTTLATPAHPPHPPHPLANSQRLWNEARAVMPGGVSSPVRAFGAVGGNPIFIDRAEGPYIFDADGTRYIDLVGSWGPAIVGHAHPQVVAAVQEAAARGLSFGACCGLEAQLARRIIDAFPAGHIEMVRFVNSGTEATMSAVRLARGITGRDKIIKFAGCYHGHADAFLISAGSGAATFGAPTSPGVPALVAHDTLTAPYNDSVAVEALLQKFPGEVAAIIVEPLAGNMGFVPPAHGFLEKLRTLCDIHNALLIFDEVMTGFRVAYGGYQNLCNVRPDLTTFGKVIGGGMPVAAYAGPRDFMERLSPLGPIYQAGTLSGNPLGMAAGIQTLDLCAQGWFYQRLHRLSTELVQGLQHAAADVNIPVQVGAQGGMLGFAFSSHPLTNFADSQAGDHARYARFFHAMLKRGIWLPPSSYEAMFLSAAHTPDDIQEILAAAKSSLKEIA
jgi:glutamate-1-semialdehyde 2,1-aminomutase